MNLALLDGDWFSQERLSLISWVVLWCCGVGGLKF